MEEFIFEFSTIIKLYNFKLKKRREWDFKEMIKFIKNNGNCCLITNIPDYELSICIDRLTDDLTYNDGNCILLNNNINCAKGTIEWFFSTDTFKEYYGIDNINSAYNN
ncbi:unnamed protein product [Cunninghamella blakesleeana]